MSFQMYMGVVIHNVLGSSSVVPMIRTRYLGTVYYLLVTKKMFPGSNKTLQVFKETDCQKVIDPSIFHPFYCICHGLT